MKALVLTAAVAGLLASAAPSDAALVHLRYDGAKFEDPWSGGYFKFDSDFLLDTDVLGRPLVGTSVSWYCASYTCTGDQDAVFVEPSLGIGYNMLGGFFGFIGIASFSMTFDAYGGVSDWYVWAHDDPFHWVLTSNYDGVELVQVFGPDGEEMYVDSVSDGPGVWYIDGQRASGVVPSVPLPAALPFALSGALSLAGLGLMRRRRTNRA